MTERGPDYNYFAIALGGIVFALGLALASEAFPEPAREGPVYCGDKEMSPGAVCWTIGRGIDTHAKNYDTLAVEQLAGHGWLVWLLCLGIFISVAAVIVTGLYIGYVRRLARKSS